MTADELLRIPEEGYHYELVQGRTEEDVTRTQKLGKAYGSNVGF